MRVSSFFALIAAGILVAHGALAGAHGDATEMALHIFDVSDKDQSGSLSADEFEAAQLRRYGLEFEAFDGDGDGEASRREYLDVFMANHPPMDHADI